MKRLLLLLLMVGVPLQTASFGQEDLPARIRTARPSRAGAKLAMGPLLPVRWGLSEFGKAFNQGLVTMQERRALERLRHTLTEWQKSGFIPLYGGMGDGAGFALGLRYTRPVGSLQLQSTTQASARLYQHYSVELTKDLGPLRFGPLAVFRHRPQEDFFGIGADSLKQDRTTFSFQDENAGWRTAAKIGRVRFEHTVRWNHVEIGRGTDRRFPELQQLFDEQQAPGRFVSDDWLANDLMVSLDLRDNPADPRAGVRIEAAASTHEGLNETQADYTTYRLAAFVYVPLSAWREHVFALRSELIHTDSDGVLPFYAQPTLGGSGTLRGYREYRFRDRDAFLASAEYRYEVWRHMDAVLFTDLGQVYSDVFDQLSARSLRSSVGAGLRFKSSRGLVMRVNAGQSIEGARLFFTFGPSW